MEPARSDAFAGAPGATGDERGGGRPQNPRPAPAYPVGALWPWAFQAGSRHVPVVGPTEALPGRAGGPGVAVPSGAVPGLLGPARRSSWQLAQEVWQESGVSWERPAPELADPEPAPDPDPATGWLPDRDPPDFVRQPDPPRAPDPADVEFPAPAWTADPDAEYRQPAGLEPAADDWYADPATDDADPADTWFTGVGPADARLADARPAGSRPPGDRLTAAEGTGPHFADSGVAPLRPELPSRRHPRPPAFPPADDPWAAAQPAARPDAVRFGPARNTPRRQGPAPEDFRRPDPAGDDAMRRGPAGRNPTRPEPLGEDLARDDARGLGSPQDRAGFGPSQPRRPGPTWNEYPPSGYPGQAWPAGSGRVPLGAPVAPDPQAPESIGLADPFDEPRPDAATSPGWADGASLSEPDELFRAWQGSVNEAAAGRGPWSVPGRGARASRRRRALQAAAIGVPVAVIVTVGAGALMILTGKANDMLAVRADTGSASPADTATGSSGIRVGGRATPGGVPSAFVGARFSGYPGQRGSVTVASMATAAGVTLAAGAADGRPAIWRRAANGSWTLESAASLGAVTGGLGLASVAYGPAGWIAVGTASNGRATEPVVLASSDGLRWQPVSALTGQLRADTLFLGAAASRAGYVVVGRQMIGGRAFAVLWYSADLRSWTADDNGGLDGRLQASTVNAVAATANGFVAVGSHGAAQSFWVSSDGRHWRLGYKPAPAGAASATLRSVAATGSRVVAGGYAASAAGDIPVLVVSTDGGAHWRQLVLQAPNGLGVITALTATPDGFTAAGVVGRRGAQHAVTWTSPDGLTWSAPAQAPGSEITALAADGTTVTGTAEQGTTPTLVPLPAP